MKGGILVGAALGLLGQQPWVIRLASAVIGVLGTLAHLPAVGWAAPPLPDGAAALGSVQVRRAGNE